MSLQMTCPYCKREFPYDNGKLDREISDIGQLFVKSDPNGAYNILDIAKYQGNPEFDEILKHIALRLSSIENILGDDYDLDRLRELAEADREGRCVVLERAKLEDIPFTYESLISKIIKSET